MSLFRKLFQCAACGCFQTANGHDVVVALAQAEAENARLRDALKLFLEDPRFHVSIGGNPNAVEKMLEQARAALEVSKK